MIFKGSGPTAHHNVWMSDGTLGTGDILKEILQMLRALAWAHSCGSAAQLWWGPRRRTPKCRKCAQSTPSLLGSTGRGRGRLVSEGHGRFSLLFYKRSFFQGDFFPQPRNRGPHDQVAGLTHCDTPCPCKGTLNTWNCPQATDIPPPPAKPRNTRTILTSPH